MTKSELIADLSAANPHLRGQDVELGQQAGGRDGGGGGRVGQGVGVRWILNQSQLLRPFAMVQNTRVAMAGETGEVIHPVRGDCTLGSVSPANFLGTNWHRRFIAGFRA